MTIQRQYSLPNCKLILEGLTNDNPLDTVNARPQLTMLTNVECHLTSLEKPLAGGREFLEILVKAVSEYAQDYLSGIPHASRRDRRDDGAVQLYRIDKNLHRLSLQPPVTDGNKAGDFPPPMEIDLTTVQLFDLVEAVDQLYADAQTVPELSLSLSPLPRRYVVSQEPITKRAVPAALGISSLAVAAAAMFFLPVPEVRRPEEANQTTEASPTETSPDNSPNPPAGASPASEQAVSPSPTAEDGTATNAEPADLDAIAATVPNISDPGTLETLTSDLQSNLYTAWADKPDPSFEQPLEYRVGVDESGRVIGYRFVNEAALTYLNEIPLSDVQFPAPEGDAASPTSIAQFLVVFRPDEIIEISPWYGTPPEPAPPAEGTQGESAPETEVEPEG